MFMSKILEKLGQTDERIYIETVSGVGYRFISQV